MDFIQIMNNHVALKHVIQSDEYIAPLNISYFQYMRSRKVALRKCKHSQKLDICSFEN